MLITFKSKAAAEIIMFPEHAKMLLDIIGKEFSPANAPQGIVTPEQAAGAVAALKAAIAAAGRPADDDEVEDRATISVSLAQRAYPLLDMLERADKKGTPVVWGV